MELTAADALRLRMASLLLAERGGASRPKDVAGVVTWFGAMQAQDLGSVLWSLGARLPELTLPDVRAALERREALRTWPMRGTVHLIPPQDAHWMLEVMGEKALAGATARRGHLGLTEKVADRAVEVLGAALAGGGRMTRAQCLATLTEAGVDTAGQLGYHLLWYASQRGVTCIAPNQGTEQTFALLDEWAPDAHRPDRDEALGTIVLRYFRSHGPTTRKDFAGWTGLGATDAKRGLAVAGDALTAVTVDGQEMFLDPALLDGGGPAPGIVHDADGIRALPGFDEYLLGYKDRSMMVDDEHKQAIIPGGNGVFQPTLVRAGRVIGTWRRTATPKQVTIDIRPLVTLRATDRKRVDAAFEPYAAFLQLPVRTRWP
ncbi:MAG: hypothetical protein V7637_2706 [Mycobacteriales bacterium]